MKAFVFSTILLGMRARGWGLLTGLVVLMLAVVLLGANFSARNPDTLALDLGTSIQRLALTFVSLFWVQEFLARDIEAKSVISQLVYPGPRWHYLLGRFFGFLALAAGLQLLTGLALNLAVQLRPSDYEQVTKVALGFPYLVANIYQFVDLAVVIAFAVLISTVSTTPFLPMAAGLCFAVLARSLGPTIELLNGPGRFMDDEEAYAGALNIIAYIIPNLDSLDIRQWPLYGVEPSGALLWPMIMAMGYLALCLALAVVQFEKRSFQ